MGGSCIMKYLVKTRPIRTLHRTFLKHPPDGWTSFGGPYLSAKVGQGCKTIPRLSEQCRNYAVCRAAKRGDGEKRKRRERERFVRRRRKRIAALREREKERLYRGRRIVNTDTKGAAMKQTNTEKAGRGCRGTRARAKGGKVRGRRR